MQTDHPCPCGRLNARKQALGFANCCGLYINNFASTPAPDAEALMRSRYSAFVLQRADYLLATWHSSQRPANIEFDAAAKWLGLEVRQHRVIDAPHAEVEFVARQKSPASPAIRLHERSRFVREDGRWYYLDGEQL